MPTTTNPHTLILFEQAARVFGPEERFPEPVTPDSWLGQSVLFYTDALFDPMNVGQPELDPEHGARLAQAFSDALEAARAVEPERRLEHLGNLIADAIRDTASSSQEPDSRPASPADVSEAG